jgi:hypothetical protein
LKSTRQVWQGLTKTLSKTCLRTKGKGEEIMRKMFLKITLIACLGLVFAFSGLIASLGMPVRGVIASASTPETVTITVQTNMPQVNADLKELIIIRVVCTDGTFIPYTLFGASAHTVQKDATISIVGASNSFFEWTGTSSPGITPDDGADVGDTEFRFVITQNRTVTVNFEERIGSFSLSVSGRAGRDDVALGSSVSVALGNPATYVPLVGGARAFELQDVLYGIRFGGIPGYVLDGMSIRLPGSGVYSRFEFDADEDEWSGAHGSPITYRFGLEYDAGDNPFFVGQVLDTAYLAQVLNGSEIIIILELTRLHRLDIVLPPLSEGMGTYSVTRLVPAFGQEILGGTDFNESQVASRVPVNLATNRHFADGTWVEITATPNPFHVFRRFDNIQDSATVRRYQLLDDRVVTLNFRVETFELSSDMDPVNTSDTWLRVGQTLIFTFDVPENNSIKKWVIRNSAGVVIADSRSDDFINISGNGVTVRLEGTMLTGGKFDLVHDVDYGLNDIILFGIIGGGVVIPLLLIILIGFMAVNAKRKKLIKAQLEGKWSKMKEGKNIGALVGALREGQDGTISKAQIKEELKKQKADAKAKPPEVKKVAPAPKEKEAPAPKKPLAPEPKKVKEVPAAPAPAPAPTPPPAPAKPAAVPMPELRGTKMQPNRTMVDASGNIVAGVKMDGSVVDLAGNTFAKIRMEDGSIVSLDGKVLGVVQGDGSIK